MASKNGIQRTPHSQTNATNNFIFTLQESMAYRAVVDLTDQQREECLDIARDAAVRTPPSDCDIVDTSKAKALSQNAKGYVQIKVYGHISSNKKVQLHQLVAWMHPDPAERAILQAAINRSESDDEDDLPKKELSHLCKQKACMNPQHIIAESCTNNKLRNNCTTIIRINGIIHSCCKHIPRCIATQQDLDEVLEYNV